MRYLFVIALLAGLLTARADVAVLTQHNDLARTGDNLKETILNTGNVNTNAFGLVYTRPVDDQVYAQPLVMTNVSVPGKGVHNLLIIATVNDSVYAFDADDSTVSNAYWHTSFTNANAVAPNNSDIANLPNNGCGTTYPNISGNFGIVSTPVIDPASGTVYALARTKEFGSTFVQRIHALDITTGAERSFSPVVIAASVPGNGTNAINNVITFDPLLQNQRSSLALVNGVVYIAWTSHCDTEPYHGWLLGYSATNLQQLYVYCSTPDGSEGGIWMAGEGPSADASGNIYISVANGTTGSALDPTDLTNRGESFLKLTPTGTNLAITSWFTPYNWSTLNAMDWDLGSAGMLLIPGTSLAFSGGKQGVLYLVNRDNMGGLSSATNADTNIVQTWSLADGNEKLYGSPVWWDGPTNSYVYFWPGYDYLYQYQFDRTNQVFLSSPAAQGSTLLVYDSGGHPGGMLSISANGTNAGTGILWASHPTADAQNAVQPGVLRAYNAQNVTNELWNSTKLSRDSVGNFGKFVPPTIANGKVYLATFSSRINVYGLLPTPTLKAAKSGTNIALYWPTNFSGFSLQTNVSLVSGNWGALTNKPVAQGTNYTVTNRAPTVSTFYRLKR
jgi:hypothetical protein